MADSVEILPEIVRVKIEVPVVSARVETPEVSANVEENKVPVVIVPGKPGPPGKDGSVVGGAVIDDGAPQDNRVWSSQQTHDQDLEVVDSLTPEIDLILLFNNALA
ncbi:hypothetical protein SEA_AVAZAK_3 [Gordonia phage Avazak]|uniref:Uncharacterized protein n=1 Tax=Gordonia phage Avazak TaxID=2656529 RepID=A0A649V7L1_9CAUD|nr:hypothetical protein HWC78_gp03 [Gordonia phage Avazak]QGJ87985.1 hypothetical protein SEA_AVAZAK_3 [Gordonia phage Avazak]WNM72472.1 hypothetical protein SEA_ARTORIAS_3 [Gordonia phage Artorias]